MIDFPIAAGDDPNSDTDFQAQHLFEEPFLGLTTAIGWIAHRNVNKAFAIGFWRFCDISARDRSLFAAKEDLWRALQEGKIAANGIDARDKTVDIPALEWRFLEFAPAVDSVVSYRDSSRRYVAVAVGTSEFLKLRPPCADAEETRKRGRKPTEQRLQMEDAMRREAAGGYNLRGATDAELEAKFGAKFGLKRSTVLRVRDVILSEINSEQLRTKNN